MGTVVPFRRAGRPTAPETPDDLRDEVTALNAEAREMIALARPIVARLAIYGTNASPVVLAQARQLQHLLDRAERRTMGGAA